MNNPQLYIWPACLKLDKAIHWLITSQGLRFLPIASKQALISKFPTQVLLSCFLPSYVSDYLVGSSPLAPRA